MKLTWSSQNDRATAAEMGAPTGRQFDLRQPLSLKFFNQNHSEME
jgi:hypothetical protein